MAIKTPIVVGATTPFAQLPSGDLLAFEREVFFPADYNGTNGDYRTRGVGASGAHAFTFVVPPDFTSLVSLHVVGIVSAGAAGPAKDIDLTSDYAADGETLNNHSESNTTSTYDLTGLSGRWGKLPLQSVFSVLAAEDRCGVLVNQNAIGGVIDYVGVLLRYK